MFLQKIFCTNKCLSLLLILISSSITIFSQSEPEIHKGYPVLLDGDTLFNIYSGIGTFSAERRAKEISQELNILSKNESLDYDSIKIIEQDNMHLIILGKDVLMGITPADIRIKDIDAGNLAEKYREIIVAQLKYVRDAYSPKSLIEDLIYSLVYLGLLVAFFLLSNYLFPRIYKQITLLDKDKVKSVLVKGKEIVQSSTIVKSLIVLLKGFRFVLSLMVIYYFITETMLLWPYTRKLDLQPIIKSLVLLVFYSVLFVSLFKTINALTRLTIQKYNEWKETKIRSISIKNIELISADRTIEVLTFITKIFRFFLLIIATYIYITIIFSLFAFSKDWAEKLLNYVFNPLNTVLISFLEFLPNLFFIIVLVFVFRYVIKLVKFIFGEVERGTLDIPGFHKDWAQPTYKIVRFMILVLAAIIIFPYLPGSNSPFFQGISVFLGILFSLGSSSAIANIVSGVVLTYMRPFKIGDRVKIADTVGDVIEKTLLVTRVRTPKNVDITIPNAMVLNSHIVNFSSSAADIGLILHTTVTIGYDVPWKKTHELLIAAASDCDSILKEPKPFVLQTSLDDFYVAYELNAYTDQPSRMAAAYSELHSKIQDKFWEAGVEILSPHYGAMRDGNQTTIPEDYLPKDYQPPSFRLFGINLFGNQNKPRSD